MNKNIYKELIDQVTPSDDLIEKTTCQMISLVKASAPTRPVFRQKPKIKPALIAAVIVVLSVTTLAYGSELREIFFGKSKVTQLEFGEEYVLTGENGDNFIIGYSKSHKVIQNRSVPDLADEYTFEEMMDIEHPLPKAKFSSFEELRQAVLFEVKEPSFLPDGWSFSEAEIWLNKDGSYAYDASIIYKYTSFEYPIQHMFFFQSYAGPEAYFDIYAVEQFEYLNYQGEAQTKTVMIGDTEALLRISVFIQTVETTFFDQYTTTQAWLNWMQDDIACTLMLQNVDITDISDEEKEFLIESLLAIAESIE